LKVTRLARQRNALVVLGCEECCVAYRFFVAIIAQCYRIHVDSAVCCHQIREVFEILNDFISGIGFAILQVVDLIAMRRVRRTLEKAVTKDGGEFSRRTLLASVFKFVEIFLAHTAEKPIGAVHNGLFVLTAGIVELAIIRFSTHYIWE